MLDIPIDHRPLEYSYHTECRVKIEEKGCAICHAGTEKGHISDRVIWVRKNCIEDSEILKRIGELK